MAINTLSYFQGNIYQKHGVCFLNSHAVWEKDIKRFESLIKWLLNRGDIVDISTALEAAKQNDPKSRYFNLSFDDGLECLYLYAAPILDRYLIKSAIFVNSSVVGKNGHSVHFEWMKRTQYPSKTRVMDWNQLSVPCFELGAHTRNHIRLSDISSNIPLLEYEITGCKLDIEKNTGRSCDYFAWPYGRRSDVTQNAIEVIRDSGYKASFGAYRVPIFPDRLDLLSLPRQHIEAEWPLSHVSYFVNQAFVK